MVNLFQIGNAMMKKNVFKSGQCVLNNQFVTLWRKVDLHFEKKDSSS